MDMLSRCFSQCSRKKNIALDHTEKMKCGILFLSALYDISC